MSVKKLLLIALLLAAPSVYAQNGGYSSPPIGGGTTYTGTSPIVISGGTISCPTCSTSAGITLQTNGVANGSQTLLNIAGSTNLTATDNGSGTVTLALTGLPPAPATLAPATNQFVTGYTESTGAWNTAEVTGNDINGAASAPAFTWSGTPNTGSATTSYPLIFYNCSGSTVSGGLSTGGTIFGINTCTGFAGNLLGLYNNGTLELTVSSAGAVTANGRVNSAATSGVGPSGRSAMYSAADGRAAINNNSNTSAGLTRFTLGTEASGNPAMCPSAQTWVTCDGAGTTANGALKSASYSVVNLLANATAPTIAAGGCGGSAASITANNGTAAFNINVGTAPTSAGCTVTMPAATTGWNCQVSDQTTQSTSVSMQKQTGAVSTTSVVLQNFSDVTVATAPAANDLYHVVCSAY
jgi:hypothetical protein